MLGCSRASFFLYRGLSIIAGVVCLSSKSRERWNSTSK